MIQYLYLIFLLSASLVLEVLLRSVGMYVPLSAFAVFYAAFLCGLLPGALFGLAAGFLLDSLLGYTQPFSMLLYLLLLPLVWLLKEEHFDPKALWYQMGTGLLMVILLLLPPVPIRGGWQVTLELLPSFFLASLFSAFLLPLFILLADFFADLLNLRTYASSSRYRKES